MKKSSLHTPSRCPDQWLLPNFPKILYSSNSNQTFAFTVEPETKVNVFVFSDYISPNFISAKGDDAKKLVYTLNDVVKTYFGLV